MSYRLSPHIYLPQVHEKDTLALLDALFDKLSDPAAESSARDLCANGECSVCMLLHVVRVLCMCFVYVVYM